MSTQYRLEVGDCLDVLKDMESESVDAVVCDPPYGLSNHRTEDVAACLNAWLSGLPYKGNKPGFMGKIWDSWVPGPEVWRECLRVLKPGGHLLAFAGTRSMDLMSMAIRLSGFELRDSIGHAHDGGGAPLLAWTYGSGFPKSHDVAKAIDKAIGVEFEAVPANGVGFMNAEGFGGYNITKNQLKRVGESTDAARQWQGFGTALKPSHEPVIIAQKPIDFCTKWATVDRQIYELEMCLWSMLSASVAGENFQLSEAEFNAACASAQWSADEKCSTQADLSEAMGMSQFVSATISSLNTVLSWRRTLAEFLKQENTSIIETESSTTTDWKTLRFFASRITPVTIIQAHRSGAWKSAHACHAARSLNATLAMFAATLELSALGSATSSELDCFLDAEGKRLSPSWEPIILARKPLDGNVAANVLAHGTGGLNIDGCRVEWPDGKVPDVGTPAWGGPAKKSTAVPGQDGETVERLPPNPGGRWPANLIHDGSQEVLAAFPESTSGAMKAGTLRAAQDTPGSVCYGTFGGNATSREIEANSGSAARFFYCGKASKADREEGLGTAPDAVLARSTQAQAEAERGNTVTREAGAYNKARVVKNNHPTVKPTNLMRWLCRLVTPPGGVVLDPFTGSGSTGKAAILEGFRFIGIEQSPEYAEIARARIEWAVKMVAERSQGRQQDLFD